MAVPSNLIVDRNAVDHTKDSTEARPGLVASSDPSSRGHVDTDCVCRFPKLGAYAAFGVADSEGRMQDLLCADTLIPAGSGRSLSEEDRYHHSGTVLLRWSA